MTFSKPTDYAAYAKAAGAQWGVPPAVLVGLIDVESGGNPNAVSSAGARGATQFIPGTAARYGVMFGSSPAAVASQVNGAAHYLHDLGYSANPTRALASYNAGPGNWQAGLAYARNVLARSHNYTGLGNGTGAGEPPAVTPVGTTGGGDSGGGSSSGALHALVWIGLAATGVTLVALGATRSLGLRRQGTPA